MNVNIDSIASQDKATVLVVDDTPENIDVLRGVLKSHYTVKVAINGEQALKLCRSNQPPDLLLLDVMMPGLDGFEVCRRLKAEPATEGIPVIFVTAMNDVRDEVQGFEAGGIDYINKPVTPAIVLARVKTHLQLRSAYRFIRDTFGRYLSDEIVDRLIDCPEGLKLGGEKRNLSIMMADLRGFTSIGERLPAETVVKMINIFLGRMTEVIQKHQGTIDEFIGDAILAIFGAPVVRNDNALRAVRCALEMQQAMQDVNREYLALGYPTVEMGIGIHSGEVIVGNIGSKKRSKYGVVGRVVNTTSRIESYTIGGQILVSDSTRKACHGLLRIDGQMEVTPKGLTEPITIYDIGGMDGEQAIQLQRRTSDTLTRLDSPLDAQLMQLSGKHITETFAGKVIRLGRRDMELSTSRPCNDYSNLKITIVDAGGQVLAGDIYAKVTRQIAAEPPLFQVHATSLSPEAEQLFEARRQQSTTDNPAPLRLLHITDFHIFSDPNGLIKSIRSRDSLQAVLTHAQQHYPQPDITILGGDLAQDELASTYQQLASMFEHQDTPFMVTPGNHACLTTLRDTLIPALKQISAYANHIDQSDWQLIALNSHEKGNVSGLVADVELARLEQLLAEGGDKHTLIAIHHHPVPVGSRWMDEIGLKNAAQLWAVIDRFPQVRAVVCGHIHQAFDSMHGDVRVLGTPSTCVQFVPQQDDFGLDDKSPGYRWLELNPDGSIRTGVERIDGFIPPDLNNDEPY